jgi:uncharacterized membrane protein HdeD (DUF308 family)
MEITGKRVAALIISIALVAAGVLCLVKGKLAFVWPAFSLAMLSPVIAELPVRRERKKED